MLASFLPAKALRPRRSRVFLVALSLLGGCATLPTNGPTGGGIQRDVEGRENVLGSRIVEISPQSIQSLASDEEPASMLASMRSEGSVDTIGPGDILGVTIYEVGAGLFSGNRATFAGDAGTDGILAPSANGQSLDGGLVVDRLGAIVVPYVGRLVVAGLTPAEVQDKILAGLKGKSQSPQVTVSIRKNAANTVVVMGAVAKPGRLSLDLSREHLLDAIAESGGVSQNIVSGGSTATGTGPQDMVVRFTRRDRTVEQRLDSVRSGSPDDLLLLPGDRIEVIRQPRTFTVFGALDRISQMPFESERLSLAEALARAGGPSDTRADPRQIYVFRLLPPAAPAPNGMSAATAARGATIYRLNMMRASGYVVAQQFAMHDKDLIYISNARSNRPTKLVSILNLLFTPVFSLKALSN